MSWPVRFVVYNAKENELYICCLGYFNYILETEVNTPAGTLPFGRWKKHWINLGRL